MAFRNVACGAFVAVLALMSAAAFITCGNGFILDQTIVWLVLAAIVTAGAGSACIPCRISQAVPGIMDTLPGARPQLGRAAAGSARPGAVSAGYGTG